MEALFIGFIAALALLWLSMPRRPHGPRYVVVQAKPVPHEGFGCASIVLLGLLVNIIAIIQSQSR